VPCPFSTLHGAHRLQHSATPGDTAKHLGRSALKSTRGWITDRISKKKKGYSKNWNLNWWGATEACLTQKKNPRARFGNARKKQESHKCRLGPTGKGDGGKKESWVLGGSPIQDVGSVRPDAQPNCQGTAGNRWEIRMGTLLPVRRGGRGRRSVK